MTIRKTSENLSCWEDFFAELYFLFPIVIIYRHSNIVYLQGMRPMGVFTQLLVSLVVCLESLNRQSSTTLTPQAVMALHMHEAPVIFEPLIQICLSRSKYKVTSYVDFAPYV